MLSIQIYNFNYFIPELFLITTLLFLLIWNVLITTNYSNIKTTLKTINLIIEIFSITAVLYFFNLNKTQTIFYNSLLIDNFTTKIKLFIIIFSIIFYIFTYQYLKNNTNLKDFEIPILLAISIFSILILISTYDLITFYLSIEMQSLCFYILTAIQRNSRFSSEAGLKYFILSACSSSLLLFGIALIYGATGSTNFEDITKFITISQNFFSNSLKIGFLFLLIGFLFKLTAVPFHIWSPDVYEGAPLIITIFFSTIPKFAIFILFIKLLFTIFYNLINIWQPLLIITSTLSILFGSIAALYQKKLKRFLAYTSINHIGYMLMSIATGTLLGLHAFFIYIIIYIITMFSFFGLIASLKKSNNKNLIYLTDLLHLKNVNKFNKIFFIILLFSLAGIPPLFGFFTKLYIFFSLIDAAFYYLTVFAIITSTLSTFYYLRIIKIINIEKVQVWKTISQKQFFNVNLITYGTLFILLFFFFPNFLFLTTYNLIFLI